MPALNFKKEFASDVEGGRKRQTIRATRKYPIKIGDTLFLYTGLRTPSARKIGQEKCRSLSQITIQNDFGPMVFVDGKPLNDNQLLELAEKDGFKGSTSAGVIMAFIRFFAPNLGDEFEGQIIRW